MDGFDVVIIGFRLNARERPAKVLERLLGLDAESAKAHARKWPYVALSGALHARAQSLADALTEAGAIVELLEAPLAQARTAPVAPARAARAPSTFQAPVAPPAPQTAPRAFAATQLISSAQGLTGVALPVAPLPTPAFKTASSPPLAPAPPIPTAPAPQATAVAAPRALAATAASRVIATAASQAMAVAASQAVAAATPRTGPVGRGNEKSVAPKPAARESAAPPAKNDPLRRDIAAAFAAAAAQLPELPRLDLSAPQPPVAVPSPPSQPPVPAPGSLLPELPELDFTPLGDDAKSTQKALPELPEIDFSKPAPLPTALAEPPVAPALLGAPEIDFSPPSAARGSTAALKVPLEMSRIENESETLSSRDPALLASPVSPKSEAKPKRAGLELDTSVTGQRLFTAQSESVIPLELDTDAARKYPQAKAAESAAVSPAQEAATPDAPERYDLWLVTVPRSTDEGVELLVKVLKMPQAAATDAVYRAPIVVASGLSEAEARAALAVLRAKGLDVHPRKAAKVDPKRSGTHARPATQMGSTKASKNTG